MLTENCLVIIVSVFCLAGFIWCDDHGENAVSYTKETFDSSIEKQERMFVMFYAPWCGHCKRLAPTWDDLAKDYNVDGSKIVIGKVDCTKETGLCSEHGVRGYPTVKLFNKNKEGVKYANKRTIEDLKAFVEEALAKDEDGDEEQPEEAQDTEPVPDKQEVVVEPDQDGLYDLSEETFDNHIARGHHFVKFYAPWCGHCKRLAPTWSELASKLKDGSRVKISKVDCTAHSRVCSKFSIRGYPTLIWFTNGQKNEDYKGQRTIEDFMKFVDRLSGVQSETAKTSQDGKVPDILTDEKEVGVVSLNDDDFLESISEDFTLVTFGMFDEDGSPSAKMIPTLEKLAEEFLSKPELLVASVNCRDNMDTCVAHEARGPYPQIKLFYNGASVEWYQKERNVPVMLEYLNQQIKRLSEDHDEL